ncbi:biotin synthase BioB [Clostridium tarantellae]|uniref:Biotin synthase n=1 Tax=Clostridium tarantellae TaxID=39493 RepID=A0A6I1MIY3_9CLOT|nr:biotin synthase BioB [Clostridium tarantellae]MPQ42884.1 biotin synthase BioB [Clostridium tarantellae]
MNSLQELKLQVINKHKINKEEALTLYNEQLKELLKAADYIRKYFNGSKIELCSIINGKSGCCSEDCKYCAQSVYFNTGVKEYSLLNYENILICAKENEEEEVNRFSIVTSGKGLYGDEFNKVISYYKKLKSECSIKLCASHGIISKEYLKALKENGVDRYHHNIETSKKYYGSICTTHSYEERIQTIINAKEVGLEVCSGGIIGLGESREDRIDMALELRELGVKSIPINIFVPIIGTPLEKTKCLSEEEILKTIAIFRFINPRSQIRLAAGRNYLINYGELAFKGGANATITGNLLTTCGNKIKDDKNLIKSIGLKVDKNE